jgi:DNA-binding beta-propeller fold protein YncE
VKNTSRKQRHDWLRTAAIGFLGAMITAAPGYPQKFSVTRTIPLAGEGNWDYLLADSDARRLYATLEGSVIVVSLDTQKLVGTIKTGGFAHGVALVPESGFGYISDGEWPGEQKSPNQVIVFNLKTLQIVRHIPVGTNPDCIVYDSASKRIFAFNHGASKSVSVIDPRRNVVEKTIALSGPPEFAAADTKGKMYVNIEEPSQLVKINTRTLTVEHQWALAPCESPSALAMDREGQRLFSACFNRMMAVVDPETGKIVALPKIGDGPDAAVFDAARKLVFSANYDGTLTVVRQDSRDRYSLLQILKTAPDARTMALDQKTGTIYLAVADVGKLASGAEIPPVIPHTFRLLVVEQDK